MVLLILIISVIWTGAQWVPVWTTTDLFTYPNNHQTKGVRITNVLQYSSTVAGGCNELIGLLCHFKPATQTADGFPNPQRLLWLQVPSLCKFVTTVASKIPLYVHPHTQKQGFIRGAGGPLPPLTTSPLLELNYNIWNFNTCIYLWKIAFETRVPQNTYPMRTKHYQYRLCL